MSKKTTEFKQTLWKTADSLRGQMDSAEYKHLVLGLIFLKFISDSFTEQREKIKEMVTNPDSDFFISENLSDINKEDLEDRDYYTQDNVFWVPESARWETLREQAKQHEIGAIIDRAMVYIESENQSLKGKLDKRFGRTELQAGKLGELIDLISTIGFSEDQNSGDVLGEVYEYFLGQFASAEGKKGGEFYTPRHVVKTLVAVLSPYKGRVYDPCCGSGGMFVQSEEFVRSHGGRRDDISIYGQESNPTTWRLAAMNLSIRGFSADLGKEFGDTFSNDQFPDLKFDFVLANPFFNDSDWGGEKHLEDKRWKFGIPPEQNANFAWVQHIVHKLKKRGRAGIVLANASLTSNTSGENLIRQRLIESNIVESIVELPNKLFTNFSGPVCIWFLNNAKTTNEILLINAQDLGRDVDSKLKVLEDNDITKISETIKKWRLDEGYLDEPNFCKLVSLDEIKSKNFTLSTKRYVYEETKKRQYSSLDELSSLFLSFETKQKEIEEINSRISMKFKSLGFNKSTDSKILPHHNELPFDETLQGIADLIFRAWFVEFNPIFFPEIEQKDRNIQLWFSKERKTSELGEIPKGWEVKQIKDIFRVSIGRTPPRKEFHWFTDDKHNGIPWVSIADLKNANVYQKNTAEFLTPEAVEKFNVPVVKKGTAILSFKLTVGRVAMAGMPLTTNEAIAHFDPKENSELNTFIFYFFRNFPFDSLGSTSSIGTAINSGILKDLKIILPPQELIKVFDQTIKVFLERADID
tara:strand:- start:640 stop:2895 length:2256 start_codon:yes stop_codon:yes gene_type:complete